MEKDNMSYLFLGRPDDKISTAIKFCEDQRITNIGTFYKFQPYCSDLQGLSYEDINFILMIEENFKAELNFVVLNNDIELMRRIADEDFKLKFDNAIKFCKECDINSIEAFYLYNKYTFELQGFTYQDMSFYERIKNPEYKSFIENNLAKVLYNKSNEIAKVKMKRL